jgi:hypothetical protein
MYLIITEFILWMVTNINFNWELTMTTNLWTIWWAALIQSCIQLSASENQLRVASLYEFIVSHKKLRKGTPVEDGIWVVPLGPNCTNWMVLTFILILVASWKQAMSHSQWKEERKERWGLDTHPSDTAMKSYSTMSKPPILVPSFLSEKTKPWSQMAFPRLFLSEKTKPWSQMAFPSIPRYCCEIL